MPFGATTFPNSPPYSAEAATVRGYVCGNLLLDALPIADRSDLADDLEFVPLPAQKFTHAIGTLSNYIYFPIDAVLSLVATLENGDTLVVGSVGREGFVESDAALTSPLSQRSSFCQVGGIVARMSVHCFEARIAKSAQFAELMRRNVQAALFSAQQFTACNSKHSILQRCARWLSMTEDRVGNPEFSLTHESLAIMLGVRRAGVSQAAHALQEMGAIAYRRGQIRVLDSNLLKGAACECYEACKRAFAASVQ